jgi:hypothetical protein
MSDIVVNFPDLTDQNAIDVVFPSQGVDVTVDIPAEIEVIVEFPAVSITTTSDTPFTNYTTATASIDIASHIMVSYINGILAPGSCDDDSAFALIGMNVGNVEAGAQANIISNGNVASTGVWSGPEALIPGNAMYLTSSGRASHTPPPGAKHLVIIGIALNNETVLINLQQPIVL